MPPRNLIVLTVDALATASLQPYGCSWSETPGCNRLSAASAVFDRFIATSLDRGEVLRQYFQDPHSAQDIAALATGLGMSALLFTDSAAVASMECTQRFDECTFIRAESRAEPDDAQPMLAAELEETLLARLFAAALDRRDSLGGAPHLIWIHASSLLHTWDAPLAFRAAEDLLEDDEEADAVAVAAIEAARLSTRPPRLVLEEEDDPDLAVAWMSAYGAQVRVLDALIEVLVDEIEDAADTALVVASTSGFSLGENGWIGADAGPPRSPRIHLPMMIFDPRRAPVRCGRPVSSWRLAPTLVDLLRPDLLTPAGREEPREPSLWHEVEPRRWAEVDEPMSPICVTAPAEKEPELVLKTAPGWFYVRAADQGEHLYLKPDDRNDANDVARLKPDIVAEFR